MRYPMGLLTTLALLGAALWVPAAGAIDCTKTSVGFTPLDDLGPGTFMGFEGGLYPGGSNERPTPHDELGLALARLALPRNAAGLPDPLGGKIVFLSIGMSNTAIESNSFAPLAANDPLKHARVQFVNGAIGGFAAEDIAPVTSPYWGMVMQRLTAAGATPFQVEAVWLKEANRAPNGPFPQHAEELRGDLQAIVQDLKVLFPNLLLVYLSSRIYAGYATTLLNPEPFAYTSGFSVKWLVESQINGTFPVADPTRGVVAPWLSWGPYLWADGTTPRSDNLVWLCSEFNADGTHPNGQGGRKVADQLLAFLHSDATARVWYVHGGTPPL